MTPKKYTLILSFTTIILSNNISCMRKWHPTIKRFNPQNFKSIDEKDKPDEGPLEIELIKSNTPNTMQMFVHDIFKKHTILKQDPLTKKTYFEFKNKNAETKKTIAKRRQETLIKATIEVMYHCYKNEQKITARSFVILFPDIEKTILHRRFKDDSFDRFMKKRRIEIIRRQSLTNSKK